MKFAVVVEDSATDERRMIANVESFYDATDALESELKGKGTMKPTEQIVQARRMA